MPISGPRIGRCAVACLILAASVAGASAEDPPKSGAAAAPAAATAATAATDTTPPLIWIGHNAQGAEEWLRVKDSGVVVRVPGGEFQRRAYEGTVASEDPAPFAAAAFYVDRLEATNAQFVRFLNETKDPAGLTGPGVRGVRRAASGAWECEEGWDRMPVTAATGKGALAYASWVGGRLPTAAEWEKAAGGVEGRLYPWGDEIPDARHANYGRPAPRGLDAVGSHPLGISPFGCLDMAGNAYERVLVGRRGEAVSPAMIPVMIKGGSWLSPHPLNLRVLDLCMQPTGVAEGSVGFRVFMDDAQPERSAMPRRPEPARLVLAREFGAAIEDAKRRRVPVFLSLMHDTCGQCDRTRQQLFTDPRFVAYCNERMVVVVGQDSGDALDDPHLANADGTCPLLPGTTCAEHLALYAAGLGVVGTFVTSPGNFVIDPFLAAKGARESCVLTPEERLPKWGLGVESYLERFEEAASKLRADHPETK